MINFDFLNECTGCSVCADICPRNCIKMEQSKYGYLIPKVEKGTCIKCNLCEKVCPVLSPVRKKYADRKVFSAYNINEQKRLLGSSGSVFYLLAEFVLRCEGVVYGAAFEGHFQLKHKRITEIEQLLPLLKSKYVQSDIRGIYKEVKKDLKEGRVVLFVGTPCQCNALYKFLGHKEYENLILIDFICHGVPPQELLDKSLTLYEHRNACVIESFEFRNKRHDCLHSFRMCTKDKDGNKRVIHEKYDKFPYYQAFRDCLTYRRSCYRCKFCVKERVSDITLADFWGLTSIESCLSDTDFNKGISMCIINSDKGNSIFHKLDLIIKQYPFEIAGKNNPCYLKPAKDAIINKFYRQAYRFLPYSIVETIFFTSVFRRLREKKNHVLNLLKNR